MKAGMRQSGSRGDAEARRGEADKGTKRGRGKGWTGVALAVAMGWSMAARAEEPVVLAFTGITMPAKMETDESMNRVLASELAARGIEVHFVSPRASFPQSDSGAVFFGDATLERTGVTRVRSSNGDSPVTETMSFARCHLGVWRYDGEGKSETLFRGDVTVPVTGEPPELVPAVPVALAERIAEVVGNESSRLQSKAIDCSRGEEEE